MKSLVSIIIPTYNRAHYLGEVLDSILAQSYKNWECIVVDDGSVDYTAEIMEFYLNKDSRIKFLKRPSHMEAGGNASRNFGFEKSQGEFINWFDDDDVMLPDFISKKIEAFRKETDFVISEFYYTDEVLEIKSRIKQKRNASLFKDLIMGNQIIITGAVMFKRSFLENRKLFLPSIMKGQETEFFSRLFFEFPVERFQVVREPLFYYRAHIGAKTALNFQNDKGILSSLGYVYLQNFKSGIKINDSDVIKQQYRNLIFIIFEGVKQKRSTVSIQLTRDLFAVLIHKQRSFGLLLISFVYFSVLIGKVSYRIEKYFRLYPIERFYKN